MFGSKKIDTKNVDIDAKNIDTKNIDCVAILDAGSQFAKLIDRRIRELNVKTEILPLNTSASIIKSKGFKAIIISGGPGSVNDENFLNIDPDILKLEISISKQSIPILGICYGMQLIVKLFDGTVESFSNLRQDGQISVNILSKSLLYDSIPNITNVLLTHGDICTEISEQFNCDVITNNKIICGISHKNLPIYGVQFHPEVTLTDYGTQLFDNFLFKISKCQPHFTIQSRLIYTLDNIKLFMSNYSNDYKILVLLSGGVDSLVTGALIQKAIGSNFCVKLVHIDSGFMRENESNLVVKQLKSFGIDVNIFDFSKYFLSAYTTLKSNYNINNNLNENIISDPFSILFDDNNLNNDKCFKLCSITSNIGPLSIVDNPEYKRKIIGDTFILMSQKIMIDLKMDPNKTIIAQGTLRPDLIESASNIVTSYAETIKTHHNDTEMVRNLRNCGLILEPLKDFHKDEVRKLGLELCLDKSALYRHPFPGPGLAIRILCNSNSDSINTDSNSIIQSMLNYMINYHSRKIMKRTNSTFDEIVKNNLNEHDLEYLDKITSDHKDSQLVCHILPIKSVGVQGDGRSYKHPVVISSDIIKINWNNLIELSKFIIKTCHTINRVVYAFGTHIQDKIIDKMTICHLNPSTLNILRKADNIANNILINNNVYNNISQMPVILIPIEFDRNEFEQIDSIMFSIVLRPIISTDFMTGLPAIPGVDIPENVVNSISSTITSSIPRISRVLYDLTSKPPGTIEWE